MSRRACVLVWLTIGLALAVLLAPLTLDGDLRARACRRLLSQGWHPDHRLLPLLSLAHAELQAGRHSQARRLLQQAWPLLERYRAPHKELLWLEAARLAQALGQTGAARRALARARRISPSVEAWLRSPEMAPLRALWRRAR
jgi:hypothetical protein